MKKTQAIQLVAEKVDDLKTVIASLKTNEAISKNTRGTQLYARSRERRVLNLITTLIHQCGDEVQLSETDMDTFTLITALSSERTVNTFEAKVGESFMDVMKRYPKRSIEKIEASLDKIGLAIDSSSGKVVNK